MRKRILVVINNIQRAQEHEWYVKLLNNDLFEIEFALINCKGSFMANFLAENKIITWHYGYKGKKDLLKLTFSLFARMVKGRYHIVHTHLFEASLAGLTAAKLAGIHQRVMTRHYSDYHHVWFPSAVKYDRLLNFLATDIVAISMNVKNILMNMESVPSSKIHLIHHGIDMEEYKIENISTERISKLKVKYRVPERGPVIGAISRFTELKGLQYLLPAFKKLLIKFPDAILVMANANGDYKVEIEALLAEIPAANYRTIEFENDIAALYRLFDAFVHIPINATAEAFGQTYIESLASKVPSIFTLSGVAPEFAIDKTNCIIVPYCDTNGVYDALNFVLDRKEELRDMIENGYNLVAARFKIDLKIDKLEKLYLEI